LLQEEDRIDSSSQQLNRRDRTHQELINLNDFLVEFHHQFCQVEKIPSSAFELNPGKNELQIMFDRRHLNQILWNLCRNGWRHGTQGKSSLVLSLHVSANGQAIRIEIADDGPGVPAQAVAHLFEPFFTTESTGTGLGLYIARELCEANGGNIKYAPNQNGSHFIIYLKKRIPK
jgi:two-component system sensor histidine kinase PilS (NtrC family)